MKPFSTFIASVSRRALETLARISGAYEERCTSSPRQGRTRSRSLYWRVLNLSACSAFRTLMAA
jgi:hypothetical protein